MKKCEVCEAREIFVVPQGVSAHVWIVLGAGREMLRNLVGPPITILAPSTALKFPWPDLNYHCNGNKLIKMCLLKVQSETFFS